MDRTISVTSMKIGFGSESALFPMSKFIYIFSHPLSPRPMTDDVDSRSIFGTFFFGTLPRPREAKALSAIPEPPKATTSTTKQT